MGSKGFAGPGSITRLRRKKGRGLPKTKKKKKKKKKKTNKTQQPGGLTPGYVSFAVPRVIWIPGKKWENEKKNYEGLPLGVKGNSNVDD